MVLELLTVILLYLAFLDYLTRPRSENSTSTAQSAVTPMTPAPSNVTPMTPAQSGQNRDDIESPLGQEIDKTLATNEAPLINLDCCPVPSPAAVVQTSQCSLVDIMSDTSATGDSLLDTASLDSSRIETLSPAA